MRTLYNAFADHVARRRAILRAVTVDAEHLLARCNPNIANVCLYGYPNGTWDVCMPSEEVPSELPEPVLGINYARDGMTREEWLALVAIYSDSWLISLAFFSAARMCKDEREELFELMNRLPTCYEIVSGVRKQEEWEMAAEIALQEMRGILEHEDHDGDRFVENSDESNSLASEEGESNSESTTEPPVSESSPLNEQAEDREELPPRRAAVHENQANGGDMASEGEVEGSTTGWEDGEGDPCPSCGKSYTHGEFWIACDFCDFWFCGTCAGVRTSVFFSL
eukprot:g5070.t1